MISQQEMQFQLAALQRQRDEALYKLVLAEARIEMLQAEVSVLREQVPKTEADILEFRDRQQMTEP